MKNKMEDLRNHLFAALEGLADEDKPLDLDRAEAIARVAQTLINSAKVEVDMAKVMANMDGVVQGSGFVPVSHQIEGPRG